MVDVDKKEQYESRYESDDIGSADVADTPAVQTQVSDEAVVTTLRIFGTGDEDFRVDHTTLDSQGNQQSTETVFKAFGVSELEVGDFENPVAEVGAQSNISVVLENDSSNDVAVNLRVDERTG